MAREQMLKTRLQQKHDIEANWLKAVNFAPKEGEIVVYDAEVEGSELPEGRTTYITYPRIKIGDGSTNVNELAFVETPITATDDGTGVVKLKIGG